MLLVCIGLFGLAVNASLSCQCSDYGTQSGCQLFTNSCYWDNNECVQLITTCSTTSLALCSAPSCMVSAQNTCINFTNCAHVNVNSCMKYGCVKPSATSTVCQDFDTCAAIKYQPSCSLFVSYTSNSNEFCGWDISLNQCVAVSGCKGADLSICKSLYFCKFNFNTNSCQDVQCNALNEVSCALAKSFCVWLTSTSPSFPSSCSQNNCKNYASESSCNVLTNYNYCAWNGKQCNQCDIGNGANYLSVTAITILILGALVY